ncbi:glutathione S-transferase family protein [Sphingomonas immobilis]|uniref:Glutathione S-transferase n=1 Tax=Sphingomonas immobilis TaxID=3063997 RepID=A0ABT9A073_9SPHN|nr:glutathione S-transferase [Sphingomonas sp. CA1-15]MDO7842107.1 glutathione S-transferase [Sphingomonas sp. CA1-15]
MITVHHLTYSRSTRILWLLEEMGEPYEMVTWHRDAKMRAPHEMRKVHPLGKGPTIEDGERVIAESGAIIEYLVATYGKGRFGPAAGDADWPAYLEWLHFGESSAMLGIIMRMLGGRDGLPKHARAYADESIDLAMSSLETALERRDFLVGNALTGADVQIQYVIETAIALGLLGERPVLIAYNDRLTARPAYVRAIEKGGPTMLPRR